MTEDVYPEIQSATEALQARIAITETEVAELKESLRAKKAQLRNWRKAVGTCNPKLAPKKRRAPAGSRTEPPLAEATSGATRVRPNGGA